MYIPQPGPTRAPEVVANLGRLGNEVIAISPPDRQMLEVGAKIKPIRFTTIPFIGSFLLIAIGLILAVSTIIRSKPDAIYTLGGSMGTGLLLARLFKCPLFFEVNGWKRAELKLIKKNPISMLISNLSCWMDELEIKHSEHVVVVAPEIKEAIQRYLDIKPDVITVIPNGANIDLFKPMSTAKESLRLDSEYCYVGFVGVFAGWQGIDNLIRSAPLVLREMPNTKFLLVGDGAVKDEMVKLVEHLELTRYFIFQGAVAYTEVPRYINAMDVCVSFRKGTPASPLKLYEYALCGKPVVATDDPDNEFVEQHNAGILVDPDKPEEVASAIIGLLRNDGLREQMGNDGRKYVLEYRTWEQVAREIEEAIKAAIGQQW